jgi:zeaxanthin glucosyltransferase
VAFVGPSLPRWAEDTPFPWDWLDGHDRHVLVSMGTLSQTSSIRFMGTVLEAVAGKPYGVIVVGDPGLLPEIPENVLVVPFVPQLSLMPRIDAVVSHGGHNTTVGALSQGVPLVCAPIRDDQPILADQLARSGAGLRINFNRCKAPDVAAAIDALLDDPSYREAARRIGDSFAKAGGTPYAAELLEALVGHPVSA